MKLVSADLVLDYANKVFQAHATYELNGTGPEAAMTALESVGNTEPKDSDLLKEREETIVKLNNTIAEQAAQISALKAQASQRDIRTVEELLPDLAKVRLLPDPPAQPVLAADVVVVLLSFQLMPSCSRPNIFGNAPLLNRAREQMF